MAVERRLAAILAADVVGYSKLMGANEERTLAQVKSLFQDVVRPRAAACRGRVVKTTGDGFLLEFASVFDAFQCALEVQQTAASRAEDVPADEQIVLRIGLNIGDIMFDEGDVFGDGVNIAARLESLARPGAICVSQRAWEDLRKLPVAFRDMGEMKLKNIAQPVRAFSCVPPGAAQPPPEPPPPKTSVSPAMVATIGGAVLVLGAIAVLVLNKPRPAPPEPLAYVINAANALPCSWLQVTRSGAGPIQVSGASAVAPKDIIAQLTQGAAEKHIAKLDVAAEDLVLVARAQCPVLERLRPFRYRGPPRVDVTVTRKSRSLSRAQLVIPPDALGAAGAIYGVDPAGAVDRIVDKSRLANLKPPAMRRRPNGAYELNIDIDTPGLNGIAIVESRAHVPAGYIEHATASDLPARAAADGWRVEMLWFRVGDPP